MRARRTPRRGRPPTTTSSVAEASGTPTPASRPSVAERADANHGSRTRREVGSELLDVLDGHVADHLERLVDAQEGAVDELGLAEAAHPGPGVLHAEHQAAGELTHGPLELGLRD